MEKKLCRQNTAHNNKVTLGTMGWNPKVSSEDLNSLQPSHVYLGY